MQYVAELGNGKSLKFYYNKKVYDPNFSNISTAVLANGFIMGRIRLLDIATGCGLTGLILKAIHPELDVTITDIDREAIRVARLNAKRLGLDVHSYIADLLPNNDEQYHIITANLPTFDDKQMLTEELHGPQVAYSGGENGMELYTRLFKEAADRCVVLVCECQAKRQKAFLATAKLNGWDVAAEGGSSFALIRSDAKMKQALKESI